MAGPYVLLACALLMGAALCSASGDGDEEVLYEERFEGDLSDWLFEGPGQISLQDGALLMEVTGDKPRSGVTWCRRKFDGPVRLTYDFKPLREGSRPKASCILMAYATLMRHEDIGDWERDGGYGAYAWKHTMMVYTISYKRGPEKGEDFRRCNARFVGGETPAGWSDGVGSPATEEWETWNRLTMLGGGKDPTDYFDGDWHQVELVLSPGETQCEIVMAVDGRQVVRCVDKGSELGGPLSGGWFGLRHFVGPQRCLYDNFVVRRLRYRTAIAVPSTE